MTEYTDKRILILAYTAVQANRIRYRLQQRGYFDIKYILPFGSNVNHAIKDIDLIYPCEKFTENNSLFNIFLKCTSAGIAVMSRMRPSHKVMDSDEYFGKVDNSRYNHSGTVGYSNSGHIQPRSTPY